MIYGGVISRMVSPNHPGDPALDIPNCDIQLRKEYVAADPEWEIWKAEGGRRKAEDVPTLKIGWTNKSALAFVYPRHLDAGLRAQVISERCHAEVHADEEQKRQNSLRVESASRVRSAECRIPNDLPVPVLAGSQPVRPSNGAGHCDSARESTPSSANDVKLDSRGGQSSSTLAKSTADKSKRPSKRARMLALRQADERTDPPPDKFWWRQKQYA